MWWPLGKIQERIAQRAKVKALANQIIGSMCFFGSSHTVLVPYLSASPAPLTANGAIEERTEVTKAILDILEEQPRTWRIWVANFSSPEIAIEDTTLVGLTLSCLYGDLEEVAKAVTLNEAPLGKFVLLAAPNDFYDVDGSDDVVIEYFIKHFESNPTPPPKETLVCNRDLMFTSLWSALAGSTTE